MPPFHSSINAMDSDDDNSESLITQARATFMCEVGSDEDSSIDFNSTDSAAGSSSDHPIFVNDEDVSSGDQIMALLSAPADVDEELTILGQREIESRYVYSGSASNDSFHYRFNPRNVDLTPGKSVELFGGSSFIRICRCETSADGTDIIIGMLYRRQDGRDSRYPHGRHNELIQLVGELQEQRVFEQAVPAHVAVRNRHIIVTNQTYPSMSLKDKKYSRIDLTKDRDCEPLFCRWVHVCTRDKTTKEIQNCVRRIMSHEADPFVPGARISNAEVSKLWRGPIPVIPGGSHELSRYDVDDDGGIAKVTSRQYTYGDMFCGAGGASCGAKQAGLFVRIGVDNEPNAMKTYQLNFGSNGAECRLQNMFEFITLTANRQVYKIDILHISPPCQAFSPAHTVPNVRMDDANEAALLSVPDLIDRLKPRVVTLEETFGLSVLEKHSDWFRTLIRSFQERGYSVCWQSLQLCQWGVPQTRTRLIIMAAAPGEEMPPLPAPTHGRPGSGLLPVPTILSTLSTVKDTEEYRRDVRNATYEPGRRKLPYDGHSLAKTMTCSGGVGNYHPSGRRDFTIQEYRALQTIPHTFKLAQVGKTSQKKQVGNAVPPLFIKALFREIIKSLRRTDGMENDY